MVVRFTPKTQAPASKVRFTPTTAPTPVKKKSGLFSGLKSRIQTAAEERGRKAREIIAAGKRGEQSKAETAFQLGGQAIGGAFEGPMALIKSVTPKPIKTAFKKAVVEPVSRYVEKSAETLSDIPGVQRFAIGRTTEEIYRDAESGANREQVNLRPGAERFARNVEAVPEYLNLLPVPKATKFVAGATERTLGAGTRKVAGLTRNFAEQQAVKRSTKVAKEIDTLAGKIAQGTPEDVASVKKALSNIEVKGVKTYKQLKDRINEKIELLSNKVDEVISKNPTTRTISNLKTVINAGDQQISKNFVNEALAQLDNYFAKTNNIRGQAAVQTILQKGNTTGMTIKDINDLARLHGRELSGFNANGELASGLSRQAAENTRMGLKKVARDLYGDKIFGEADGEISSLIRARDLVEKMETNVNKLKQKIMPRNLGQRAGRLLFQVANMFSFGGLKGFLESALVPRGQGFKTLNALDLEKYLQKNLKKIETLLDANIPENDLVRRLEDVINSATEERRLMLPAPGQTTLPRSTINLPQSARETNLGLDEVRNASINQSRAFPANQPNTINASNTAQNVDIPKVILRNEPIVEPYIPEDQLPTIQKAKASGQSFDEWVKGQGETVYHSGKLEKGIRDGIFTTPNKIDADTYLKSRGGKINEFIIDGNKLKLASPETYSFIADEGRTPMDEIVNEMKKRGFNSFRHANGDLIVFDKNLLKTRSQLKAEWYKVKELPASKAKKKK